MFKLAIKQGYHETKLEYENTEDVTNLLGLLDLGFLDREDEEELQVVVTFQNEEEKF